MLTRYANKRSYIALHGLAGAALARLSRETIVAEKLEAMVELSINNSTRHARDHVTAHAPADTLRSVLCPRCQLPLKRARPADSARFDCPQCEGRAVQLEAVLDRLPEHEIERFARLARTRAQPPGRSRCPQCLARSAHLQLGDGDQALRVDACAKCALVWLDRGEWQQLPRDSRLAPSAEQQRSMQARLLIEGEHAKAEAQGISAPPDGARANAIGLMGLHTTNDALTTLGPALLSLLLCVALFTVWGWSDRTLNTLLAFTPANPFRLRGMTIITSMFVHAGLMHALFNAYFLWLSGRPVEQTVGSIGLATLFLSGGLLGTAAHWLAHAGSQVGVLGASAGISALLVFHALALPATRVRLYMGQLRRWVTMPIGYALAMWLLGQLAGACMEAARVGRVAHFAHLGGALAGVVGWWVVRMRRGGR